MCNASGRVRRRRSFTLLELLIVLAILAMVVSLAWPSLRTLSQTGQLRDAARQLRVQLLEARLNAIQSGSVWFFRYQPGTGSYEVASGSDFETADELGLMTPGDARGDDRLPDRDLDQDQSPQRELPSDIIFFDPDAEPETDLGGELGGDDISQAWSAPIVFYPNGRTLNARLRLGTRRYVIEVSLRGLTGTVNIGEVQRLESENDQRLEDL